MLALPEVGLYFSGCLFLLGLGIVMMRKNILIIMLGVEVILNSANLAFISAGKLNQTMDGQVVMFFVMAIAACEAAIGLALVVALYRSKGTLDVDDLRALRG
jgi:NADH:ubiquinone oxidoreductase subunit K